MIKKMFLLSGLMTFPICCMEKSNGVISPALKRFVAAQNLGNENIRHEAGVHSQQYFQAITPPKLRNNPEEIEIEKEEIEKKVEKKVSIVDNILKRLERRRLQELKGN